MSDALEQRLLNQFRPDFRVDGSDCAGLPAVFEPAVAVPTPKTENGTIYGQVSLRSGTDPKHPAVEVHFYHLWSRDCGAHGHPLDTEHVAVLLTGSSDNLSEASWTAQYWYAAAHENTVCDVSQIARASALHAQQRGAIIWISPGKHASYLDDALCSRGCGADRCVAMKPLPRREVINLGEVHHPMNGSTFSTSPQWPLQAKMEETNFSPATLQRLQGLPDTEIALYRAGRHPVQGVIAISSSTEAAIAQSGSNTTSALDRAGDNTTGAVSLAGDKTGGALSQATDKTGDALGRSYTDTKHALGKSVRGVGKALRLGRKPADASPETPKP